jgi:hypothetical protein
VIWMVKQNLNKYAIFFVLAGGIIAATISFFTMRPDLFWICTLILIFGFTSIMTNGNKITSSLTIAALPLYLILIVTTIPTEISLSETTRTRFDATASILFHFINFTVITIVLIKHWKKTIPSLIFFTSIFYTFYIPAFIIAVKAEQGTFEPYHAMFLNNALWFIIFNILLGYLIAYAISKRKHVPFLKI